LSLTFTDMFCGAGGSTLGAFRAGLTPVVGMNHWAIACESYGVNHSPHGAEVDCADVAVVDPRRYPSTDILLASPECTHHSYARGRKKNDPALWRQEEEAAERSRATMYDIPRFAEHHDYKAIIVENVGAAVKWGLPKGKKLKHGAYGPLFEAWLKTMEALEYEWEIVHLNAAVCGIPQSRDRLFVVFWKRGNHKPDLTIYALGYCFQCQQLGEGAQTWKRPGATHGTLNSSYFYACPSCGSPMALAVRPAADAIDWTMPAPRIGDRSKPLADNTVKRIKRGIVKAREPRTTYIVSVGGNTHEKPNQVRMWPTTEPLKTLTATNERALVVSNMANNVPRETDAEAMHAVTTGAKLYLLEHPGKVVFAGRGSGVPRDSDTEPMGTQTTINALYLLDTARRNAPDSPPVEDGPIPSIVAGGTHHALVIANYGSPKGPADKQGHSRDAGASQLGTITATDKTSLLTYRRGQSMRGLEEPIPTVETRSQHALLEHADDVDIDDCGFRMLQPHELKLGQDFDLDYYLHGLKRDQVAQIGNAVPGGMMTVLVERVAESLEPA
jgi:DNA (cytosine-5)-methyltransferase 1